MDVDDNSPIMLPDVEFIPPPIEAPPVASFFFPSGFYPDLSNVGPPKVSEDPFQKAIFDLRDMDIPAPPLLREELKQTTQNDIIPDSVKSLPGLYHLQHENDDKREKGSTITDIHNRKIKTLSNDSFHFLLRKKSSYCTLMPTKQYPKLTSFETITVYCDQFETFVSSFMSVYFKDFINLKPKFYHNNDTGEWEEVHSIDVFENGHTHLFSVKL
ncbi:hypothetical protein PCE1_000052 [Barthelona sp. PCE]